MSAFEKSGTESVASNKPTLTVRDQLIMIDGAYARQDRVACALLINDLYAHFDAVQEA